jgi:hypothetical protein
MGTIEGSAEHRIQQWAFILGQQRCWLQFQSELLGWRCDLEDEVKMQHDINIEEKSPHHSSSTKLKGTQAGNHMGRKVHRSTSCLYTVALSYFKCGSYIHQLLPVFPRD